MRPTTLGSLTAATALAVLAPLAPAGAAGSSDWRTVACADDNDDGLALGAYTVAQAQTHRVAQIPSLTLTAEHLVFASGTRCDLISLDGSVPFGQEVKGHASSISLLGELVVGGVSQGEMASSTSVTGVGGSEPIRVIRNVVLGADVFADVETGTMPDSTSLPEPWRNQPYTFTHTRTDFTASVDGRTSVKKTFTVTPATRATAKRRLTSALADADSAAERSDARRTYRLALRGVRLVMKRFHHEWSGELPR
jgi:hypothetical protein